MNLELRQNYEQLEAKFLAPAATLSAQSKGRTKSEPACSVRTAFQRDRDRILHSKSFRRLKHKTQVFLSPGGDHYRTRLTHTLEVAQIARTIARALRLNEDLTEAISLGHDLGHTPFGHAGEELLNSLMPAGFKHAQQSLRVIDVLENDGFGINLTFEVRDGILNHTKGQSRLRESSGQDTPVTIEGCVVRYADILAYVNHDLDDAIRAGLLKEPQLPKDCLHILGKNHSERIGSMVKDVIISSLEANLETICMSDEIYQALEELRSFLWEKVYLHPKTLSEVQKGKRLLKDLFQYYLENPQETFNEELRSRLESDPYRLTCDFIAGMTDRYALQTYEKLFVPHPWMVI